MSPVTQASPYRVIRLLGPDADKVLDFLQGQVSCDLARCGPDRGGRGAFCNRQGRVVADAVFLPPDADGRGEPWRMLIRDELLAPTLELVRPYAGLARVRLEPSEDSQCLPFAGETSGDYLGMRLGEGSLTIDLDPASGGTAAGGWGLMVLSGEAPPESVAEDDALLSAALKAGAPFLRASGSGEWTPHELNYPAVGMVHFDKGCYLGQEVVARMEHLGKMKKHFRALLLPSQAGSWSAGDRLGTADGRELMLIDAVPDAAGGWILAACVPDRLLQGSQLPLADGSEAQVLGLED